MPCPSVEKIKTEYTLLSQLTAVVLRLWQKVASRPIIEVDSEDFKKANWELLFQKHRSVSSDSKAKPPIICKVDSDSEVMGAMPKTMSCNVFQVIADSTNP